jgi:hypothetical protein
LRLAQFPAKRFHILIVEKIPDQLGQSRRIVGTYFLPVSQLAAPQQNRADLACEAQILGVTRAIFALTLAVSLAAFLAVQCRPAPGPSDRICWMAWSGLKPVPLLRNNDGLKPRP